MSSVASLVAQLALEPHPEGGYYKRWYESGFSIPPSALASSGRWDATEAEGRHSATSILYLCEKGAKSSLHVLKADELWFFHEGCPLTVVELQKGDEPPKLTKLGPLTSPGCTIVHSVPAGTTFGAFIMEEGVGGGGAPAGSSSSSGDSEVAAGAAASASATQCSWSLVSCVVSPGFSFKDWQMEGKEELLSAYSHPLTQQLIKKLAHDA